jgi:pimeloyl-ACP methyl ester carboxylesterase
MPSAARGLPSHAFMAARAPTLIQDENKLFYLKLLIATMSERFEQRQERVHNDLKQYAAIIYLPWASVACPTLIFQGTADKDLTPSHAEYANAAISGSELYWIKDGSHIAFWAAEDAYAAQKHALTWLREKLGI